MKPKTKNSNKKSKLLSANQNEQLFALLGRKCQAISTAVVRLFTTEAPHHSVWIKRQTGALCFVRDSVKRSYFMRLYCLVTSEMVWEEEMYGTIDMGLSKEWLLCFEGRENMVALDFASNAEAKSFYKKATSTIRDRCKRSLVANTNQPKEKAKKKLTTLDIGTPTNFQHLKRFDLFGKDDNRLNSLNLFLQKAGVSEQELSNHKTRDFIYEFIETNNVLKFEGNNGGVKGETQNNGLQSSTPPPPPPIATIPKVRYTPPTASPIRTPSSGSTENIYETFTTHSAQPPLPPRIMMTPVVSADTNPPAKAPSILGRPMQYGAHNNGSQSSTPPPLPPISTIPKVRHTPPPTPSSIRRPSRKTTENIYDTFTIHSAQPPPPPPLPPLMRKTTEASADTNAPPKAPSTVGRNMQSDALFQSIRDRKVELRPAAEREPNNASFNSGDGNTMASALRKALEERLEVVRLSSDESDESGDLSDTDWDD